MKKNKNWMIGLLTLILSGSVILPKVHAYEEAIPEVEIQRLSQYQGKYLTVLYAVGNQPMLSTNDHDIRIRSIRLSQTLGPIQDNLVTIDATTLSRSGFGGSFNYVIVVIHDQPSFIWKNADGSIPEYTNGLPASQEDRNFISIFIKAFNRKQIPDLNGRNSGNTQTKVRLVMPI
jgi:hypothetical protein